MNIFFLGLLLVLSTYTYISKFAVDDLTHLYVSFTFFLIVYVPILFSSFTTTLNFSLCLDVLLNNFNFQFWTKNMVLSLLKFI